MALTRTYSFLDVQATITGPGGIVNLGSGAGNAEEGITIEFSEETDRMLIGSDGTVAHSLIASRAGKVTVRLIRTSPTNSALMNLYNLQRTSSVLFGQNTIVISNPISGDVYTCQQSAFARNPTATYAKEVNVLEWDFNAGQIDAHIGNTLAIGF